MLITGKWFTDSDALWGSSRTFLARCTPTFGQFNTLVGCHVTPATERSHDFTCVYIPKKTNSWHDKHTISEQERISPHTASQIRRLLNHVKAIFHGEKPSTNLGSVASVAFSSGEPVAGIQFLSIHWIIETIQEHVIIFIIYESLYSKIITTKMIRVTVIVSCAWIIFFSVALRHWQLSAMQNSPSSQKISPSAGVISSAVHRLQNGRNISVTRKCRGFSRYMIYVCVYTCTMHCIHSNVRYTYTTYTFLYL